MCLVMLAKEKHFRLSLLTDSRQTSLLSSARGMACANHSKSNFLVQEEFFAELKVFRLNMDSKTFLNVILSDLCKLSLS